LLVGHLLRFAAGTLVLCVFVVLSHISWAEGGRASWYALTTRTASGERCDPYAMTAAHRSLPFNTVVSVENIKNGRRVLVRVNDRGPFVGGRIIDVTRAAANRLDFLDDGITKVRLTVIGGGR
jgi:rare lipoprotein A